MSSSTATSLIQAVLQASKRTFARSRNRFKLKEEDFVSSLRDLKSLLDNVRTHDLGKQNILIGEFCFFRQINVGQPNFLFRN